MMLYETGQQFPEPNTRPGTNRSVVALTTSFFDLNAYLSSPDHQDIAAWKKGKLCYGLYCEKDIPFFLLDFPKDEFNMDASINIRNVPTSVQRDAWLNTQGNLVSLFLIDATTNILVAMRAIALNSETIEKLKDTLEAQTYSYDTAQEVKNHINAVYRTRTTADMIKKTKMVCL